MAKQRLVVVGNGMAGARAVEEVLARGGGDRFDIVMFGDEPYGNYNRILLSNILSGAQDASEIFINPLDWYGQNAVKLHAGSRVEEIDRAAKLVSSANGVREHYDKLLIATGSRAFIPPMAGVNGPDGRLRPGVFGFRTIDDCDRIVAQAKQCGRAAVIGGGLLASRPRAAWSTTAARSTSSISPATSWRCSSMRRRARSSDRASRRWGSTSISRSSRRRFWATAR
jgi:nitrite reductase (NADH) large subunit